MEPFVEYIEQVDAEHPEGFVTVALPEFVPAKWWHHLFHSQRALLFKGALLFKPTVVVTSVPLHLSRQAARIAVLEMPKERAPRSACRGSYRKALPSESGRGRLPSQTLR